VLAELAARVVLCLTRWNLPPTTQVSLLNVSENATYLLRPPAGGAAAAGRDLILRVHRIGYSSAEEIRSELTWMAALRGAGVLDTAVPVAGADGDLVQWLASPSGAAPRVAVAFERLPGCEPAWGEAAHWFERLGEFTARLHAHARGWSPPAAFVRKRWDFDAMVGPDGFWGPWRAGIGLEPRGTAIVERALDGIRAQLERYGQGPDVFGLVHADLRPANLLVDGTRLRIIDFDDCGFCWYLYDFATSVSFIEHEPIVPALLTAWTTGYRKAMPLTPEALALIPSFVVLRRVLLTAWLASHAEVPFAREFGESYTAGTVALAEALLAGRFLQPESAPAPERVARQGSALGPRPGSMSGPGREAVQGSAAAAGSGAVQVAAEHRT
jgi:Ser/Thr protein kinase RdoA (MazF antagonist)